MGAGGPPGALGDAPPAAGAPRDAAALEGCVRDLLSLLALPAIVSGRDLPGILQQFCDALAHVLAARMCLITTPALSDGDPPVVALSIDQRPVLPVPAAWCAFAARHAGGACADLAAAPYDTPEGTVHGAALQMDYPSAGGWVFASSDRADFPAVSEAALLRAAASLASGSVKAARLVMEREAAGRAKDEFLAMLGHELRNPLSPIVTAVELMKMRGDSSMQGERALIERQVAHLMRLVDDLLDVSRITRGKIELRMEMVEIWEVAAKAVEMTSLLLEQRSHQLSVDVPRGGLLWYGDVTRLAQVMSNLLTNAARYTEPGGNILLWARREGERVVIGVRDNGSGVAPEVLPHVFDLFYQGPRSIERREGGLGLGLALVKNLVRLHGGDVLARSDGPGRGSEFVVSLPAPDASVLPEKSLPLPPAHASPAARRVLVVDDNTDAADALSEFLATGGHDVRVAYDPAEALTLCATFEPDIAILDIGLPVMDGYQLAVRLRALRPLRLVALSGYGGRHDVERSREAGFERHLVKPVDPTLLAQVVAETATETVSP